MAVPAGHDGAFLRLPQPTDNTVPRALVLNHERHHQVQGSAGAVPPPGPPAMKATRGMSRADADPFLAWASCRPDTRTMCVPGGTRARMSVPPAPTKDFSFHLAHFSSNFRPYGPIPCRSPPLSTAVSDGAEAMPGSLNVGVRKV
ncbi:uncharacterized protein DNG_00432 [Cephalotrichum gorgonifer]|uniref:Uncharacterized protein n=1 Tax=Cephalotrichum gorgonifer TaxID=2041049 RepID=A0AAE8MP75_9PEZI|nr:uncharacterized protein DNG_00432 [Cephalotrichum gorgonifer]